MIYDAFDLYKTWEEHADKVINELDKRIKEIAAIYSERLEDYHGIENEDYCKYIAELFDLTLSSTSNYVADLVIWEKFKKYIQKNMTYGGNDISDFPPSEYMLLSTFLNYITTISQKFTRKKYYEILNGLDPAVFKRSYFVFCDFYSCNCKGIFCDCGDNTRLFSKETYLKDKEKYKNVFKNVFQE